MNNLSLNGNPYCLTGYTYSKQNKNRNHICSDTLKSKNSEITFQANVGTNYSTKFRIFFTNFVKKIRKTEPKVTPKAKEIIYKTGEISSNLFNQASDLIKEKGNVLGFKFHQDPSISEYTQLFVGDKELCAHITDENSVFHIYDGWAESRRAYTITTQKAKDGSQKVIKGISQIPDLNPEKMEGSTKELKDNEAVAILAKLLEEIRDTL